jgi:hypothetical protein
MEHIMTAVTQAVVQPQDYSVTTQGTPTDNIGATNGLAPNVINPPSNTPSVTPTNTQDTANRELLIADAGASVNARGGDPTLLAQRTTQPGIVTTQSPVNFNAIPADRKADLNNRAEQLIDQYAASRADPRVAPNGTPLPEHHHRVLDYNSFKNILTDLKNDRSMSDNEKAYVWSEIADQKGSSSPTSPFTGFSGGTYRPSINGSNPDVRDSDLGGLRARDTPGHTVLSFQDSYHGFGAGGMGYQTRDAAWARIADHETPRGLTSPLGFNRGDANASMAMVDAFHAYRDAPTGHKFESFANQWIAGIVAR